MSIAALCDLALLLIMEDVSIFPSCLLDLRAYRISDEQEEVETVS